MNALASRDHLKGSAEIELFDYQSKTVYNLNLITKNNTSGCNYSILVYDITNEDSFNHLKSVQVPTANAYLIGTKLDLERKRQV